MSGEKTTIMEATKKWVSEFNAIEYTLFENAVEDNYEDLHEFLPVTVGDIVSDTETWRSFEVKRDLGDGKFTVEDIDDGEVLEKPESELRVEKESMFPMWGWLWSFGNGLDEEWARENPEKVVSCGFRMYEYQPTGTIYIGVDGAGYNFYSHHWVPLYKARGLKWHDVEE